MARGRKTNKDNSAEVGVLKLVKFNPLIIEEKRNQNILLDEFVSMSVDANGNWELFQIKQTVVTEENIKSTKTIYGEKYKLGDIFQEWYSMGKYLGSPETAIEYYSNLKFNNEVSQLRYCADMKELAKIRQNIHDGLNNFMIKNTVPDVVNQVGKAIRELQEITKLSNEVKLLISETSSLCSDTIIAIKEKNKIIVADMPKQKKHKIVEENA